MTPLSKITHRIQQISLEMGEKAMAAAVLAVSKSQSAEAVAALYQEGQRAFGESKVQEAARKFLPLRASCPDVQLHLIGHLQRNKVAAAVALFDVIETLDSIPLAEALAHTCRAQGRWPRLFIQVNVGQEPQKSGVAPADFDLLLMHARQLGLPVDGVMGLPPEGGDPVPYFKDLATLAARYHLPNVSMGMSADYESAVRCGATEVRLGTALFGAR